jgi:hypothetical protein
LHGTYLSCTQGSACDFPLPPINTARDAVNVSERLLRAVAAGQVTPIEAAEISKVITGYVKAVEIATITDRMGEVVTQLTDAELWRIARGEQHINGALLSLAVPHRMPGG